MTSKRRKRSTWPFWIALLILGNVYSWTRSDDERPANPVTPTMAAVPPTAKAAPTRAASASVIDLNLPKAAAPVPSAPTFASLGHGETSMIGEAIDGEVHLMVDFYGDEHDRHGVAGGRLRDEGYSDEFVALLRWAAAKGARAVALDAEGAVVDELPVLANGSGSGRAPGR